MGASCPCHHVVVVSPGRVICLAAVLVAVAPLAGAAPLASRHWRPRGRLTWYWQLQGRINDNLPAAAYDVDGFDTGAGEVSRLERSGHRVVCYIDAGTWENWRPDAKEFPHSVLGRGNGWPGERWLDIRQPVVRRLMVHRFRTECQRKGFDALEADNIDAYQARSGFPITARDQLSYDRWIAREAHVLGLAVFQKNDPDQVRALEPYFDGELAEQCSQYRECSRYEPYLIAGKPVLDSEYALARRRFCASDMRLGIMAARYDQALDGGVYRPCWR